VWIRGTTTAGLEAAPESGRYLNSVTCQWFVYDPSLLSRVRFICPVATTLQLRDVGNHSADARACTDSLAFQTAPSRSSPSGCGKVTLFNVMPVYSPTRASALEGEVTDRGHCGTCCKGFLMPANSEDNITMAARLTRE